MILKDCCKFQEGYVNPSQTNRLYFNGPIKWLRASDLNDSFVYTTERTLTNLGFKSAGKSALLFEPETLAISKSGSIGHLGILKDFMCGNRAVINIKVNPQKADLLYIFYTLKFKKNRLIKGAQGSIQKNLYISQLEKLHLNHEDLNTQKQIASILSALDDKIELNNRINTELEAMAKTIYNYWFVQFDFPDTNGKPYKSSGGKMVYNDVLKREVPEGWEVSMLAEHLNCNKNNIGKNHELETINYLDTSSLTENRISFLQKLNVKKDIVPSRAQRIVTNNDILISTVRPNLRHFGLIKRPAENMIASTGFALLNHKTTNNYNDFFYMYITSDAIQKKLESVAASSVSSYPSINPTDILDLAVPLPKDFGIIDTLSKTLSSFFTTISVNQEQNQQLSQLRDWLLPMLMNGQVSVADAYQQAAQALSMAAEDAAGYNQSAKLSIPKNKTVFAKQVLAGKIVSLFKDDKNFTRIKFQKLQFLAEHIGEADLALNYYFQSAGPYDNRFMHTIIDSLRKSKWFDEKKYKFKELEKQSQIETYYNSYFSPVSAKFEKLFTLLANTSEAETEIIATIYAVWNNRLILKQSVSEENLIDDFYKWSDRKHRYSKEQILAGKLWLKKNNFEPTGFGKEIKMAKK